MDCPNTDKITVVLVEDHPIFRDALRGYIQIKGDKFLILGEAETSVQALSLVEEKVPDIVLFDLELKDGPAQRGLQVISQIREVSPATKVVVLTGYADHVFAAIKAGATAYLLKRNVQPDEVCAMIQQVHEGRPPLDPDVARELWTYFQHELPFQERSGESLQRLSSREREVLQLVAEHRSNQQIADVLVISVKTVKTHVSNILDKLHLSNREQLRLLVLAGHPTLGSE